MNRDMVKPMPASSPTPIMPGQVAPAGSRAETALDRDEHEPDDADRLAEQQAGKDAERDRAEQPAALPPIATPALKKANTGMMANAT